MVGWLIPARLSGCLSVPPSRFALEFVCLILFHVSTITSCLAFSVARFASVVNGTEFGLLG